MKVDEQLKSVPYSHILLRVTKNSTVFEFNVGFKNTGPKDSEGSWYDGIIICLQSAS